MERCMYFSSCNSAGVKLDTDNAECASIVETQIRVINQHRSGMEFLNRLDRNDPVEVLYTDYTVTVESPMSISDFKRIYNRWIKIRKDSDFLKFVESQNIFIVEEDYLASVYKEYEKFVRYSYDFPQFVAKYSQYSKQFSFKNPSVK